MLFLQYVTGILRAFILFCFLFFSCPGNPKYLGSKVTLDFSQKTDLFWIYMSTLNPKRKLIFFHKHYHKRTNNYTANVCCIWAYMCIYTYIYVVCRFFFLYSLVITSQLMQGGKMASRNTLLLMMLTLLTHLDLRH